MNYQHLSEEERDRLALLKSQGKSLRFISRELGRSHSTLVRELKRNRHKPPWGPRVYYPHKAQRKAQERLRQSHRRLRLKSAELHQEVIRLLEKRWSPELIAGRLKRTRSDLPSLSPETIYQWIYQRRPDLVVYLARAHRKRRRRWAALKHRVRIPRRISIRLRPDAVQHRQEPGHWETDLVVGPGSSALQVLVERQTRYTRLSLVPQRTARQSRAALTHLLESIPAHLRRSITYDNGAENYEHLTLNDDFGLNSYFCEPYHSWEKGTVENTNGLIRRFIPKQTVLSSLSLTHIVQVENWLNDRPRKVLNYQTPREAFQALGALAP
jgi:transposase, IS30 family